MSDIILCPNCRANLRECKFHTMSNVINIYLECPNCTNDNAKPRMFHSQYVKGFWDGYVKSIRRDDNEQS